MHSAIEKILLHAKRLPAPQKAIFDGLYLRNKSDAEIRAAEGLTLEEYEARYQKMLREIRAVGTPPVAKA